MIYQLHKIFMKNGTYGKNFISAFFHEWLGGLTGSRDGFVN
jgi:hypothetical protein